MSRFLFAVTLLLTTICLVEARAENLPSQEEDGLTYDVLVANPYTDHIAAFKKLFDVYKVDTFVEFDLGSETRYFLDHCRSVVSVELVGVDTASFVMPWFAKNVQMFIHHTNWTPLLYRCSPLLDTYNVSYRSGTCTVENFDQYLKDVQDICTFALQGRQVDIAFIDQTTVPRAAFITALFGKVAVIAAHDTNGHQLMYGYDTILQHPDYVKLQYTKGCGTTFWVHKDKGFLITYLQDAFEKMNAAP